MFQQMVKPLVITILLVIATVGHALTNDNEKVMHVMADSADLNQQEHKGTYIGNVELIQGSSNLQAAKAITQGNEKNQLVLAIANGEKGKQAHYWTITDMNKPPFHAYADTIKYYPLRHLIELIGNARVEQGQDSFSAAKISYDTIDKHVISNGDSKQRITIIYHPQKKPT